MFLNWWRMGMKILVQMLQMCRDQFSKNTRRKIARHCFTFNKILRRYQRQQDPKKLGIYRRIIIMGEKK